MDAIFGKVKRGPGAPKATRAVHLPLELRILTIALERAQRGGHTPMAPRELAQALPYVHKATGELSTYSASRIRDAVRALKESGYLADEASVRCLLLPFDFFDWGLRKATKQSCPTHGNCLARWQGDWYDPVAMSVVVFDSR